MVLLLVLIVLSNFFLVCNIYICMYIHVVTLPLAPSLGSSAEVRIYYMNGMKQLFLNLFVSNENCPSLLTEKYSC